MNLLQGHRLKDIFLTGRNRWIYAGLALGMVYLLFFDNDSVTYQMKLAREIRQMRQENRRLEREIQENQNLLDHFDQYDYLEKYARKEFLFRKKNEDIYLVKRPDSLKR